MSLLVFFRRLRRVVGFIFLDQQGAPMAAANIIKNKHYPVTIAARDSAANIVPNVAYTAAPVNGGVFTFDGTHLVGVAAGTDTLRVTLNDDPAIFTDLTVTVTAAPQPVVGFIITVGPAVD